MNIELTFEEIRMIVSCFKMAARESFYDTGNCWEQDEAVTREILSKLKVDVTEINDMLFY